MAPGKSLTGAVGGGPSVVALQPYQRAVNPSTAAQALKNTTETLFKNQQSASQALKQLDVKLKTQEKYAELLEKAYRGQISSYEGLQAKLSASNTRSRKVQDSHAKLSSSHSSVSTQLHSEARSIKSFEQTRDLLAQNIASVDDRIQSFNQKATHLSATTATLKTQLEEAHAIKETTEQENAALSATMEAQIQDINHLRKLIGDMEHEKEQLNQHIGQLSANKTNLESILAEKTATHDAYVKLSEEKESSYIAAVTRLNNDISELKSQLKNASLEVSSLTEQKQNLDTQLATVSDSLTKAEADNASLQAFLNVSLKQLEDTKLQLTSQIAALETETSRLCEANTMIQAHLSAISTLENDLQAAKQGKQEYHHLLASKDELLKKTKAEKGEIQKKLSAVEAELKAQEENTIIGWEAMQQSHRNELKKEKDEIISLQYKLADMKLCQAAAEKSEKEADSLRKQVQELMADLDQSAEQCTDLEADLSATQAKLGQYEQLISDKDSKIGQLSDKLRQFEEDVAQKNFALQCIKQAAGSAERNNKKNTKRRPDSPFAAESDADDEEDEDDEVDDDVDDDEEDLGKDREEEEEEDRHPADKHCDDMTPTAADIPHHKPAPPLIQEEDVPSDLDAEEEEQRMQFYDTNTFSRVAPAPVLASGSGGGGGNNNRAVDITKARTATMKKRSTNTTSRSLPPSRKSSSITSSGSKRAGSAGRLGKMMSMQNNMGGKIQHGAGTMKKPSRFAASNHVDGGGGGDAKGMMKLGGRRRGGIGGGKKASKMQQQKQHSGFDFGTDVFGTLPHSMYS
jgi:predicted  nucleic acid-binding Zn-ribbon protein